MNESQTQSIRNRVGFISAIVFLTAALCEFLIISSFTPDYFFYLSGPGRIIFTASGATSIVILAIALKPSKLFWLLVCLTILWWISNLIHFYLIYFFRHLSNGLLWDAVMNDGWYVAGGIASAVLLFSFYRRHSPPYKKPLLILAILYSIGLMVSHFAPVLSWLGFQLTGRGIQLGDTFYSLADFFAYRRGLWVLFVELPLLSFPVAVVVMARVEKKKRGIEG